MTIKSEEKCASGFLPYHYSGDLTIELPAPLAGELERERARKAERERKNGERARRRLIRKAEAERAKRNNNHTSKDQARAEMDEAVRQLIAQQEAGNFFDPTLEHQVYSIPDLVALRERADKDKDGDRAKCLHTYADDFIKRGLRRRIAWPTNMQLLDNVAQQCPNFVEVVDIVRAELNAARRSARPPRVPPLLLLGDPGVGKSHFCRVLANAMGAPYHQLSYDAPIAGSALTGVDPQWGTAKAGLMIETVCGGEYANPTIVLDELDKALRGYNDDPIGPLHTLLEHTSAKHFRDIFIGLPFDASLVTWIATANDAERIPSTIRSRLTEITIGPPTGAQAIEQATAIMVEVVQQEAPAGFKRIDPAFCVQLAHLTPRELKKALSAAIRRAVENRRNRVEQQDFPRAVFDDAIQDDTHTWLH